MPTITDYGSMQVENDVPQRTDLVEHVARALKPQAFKIYDAGYPSGLQANLLSQAAFRNAEKNVKRARKDAAIAVDVCREQAFKAGAAWAREGS